ncbi:FkbM family methyltransferase, partial [Paraburkholderia bengalensis]
MKKLIFSATGAVTSLLPLKFRHVMAKSLLNDRALASEYG